MTFRHSLIPAAVAAALFKPVAAADEQPLQLAQFGSGDGIVVTPTRTARSVDESLASVTVIDRDAIERQQPQQFTDLLDGLAGVSVAQNGPFGKQSSISMRGTNSNHTVLLVDGVRVGSATNGQASWQFLPPSEIDRVEVVRGPRSSIYGADAIGGVVQVFTREGNEGPARLNAYTGGGSFGTYEGGAGITGGNRDTRYNFSVNHSHTDGINVKDDEGDDDDDGYTNTSLSGKVSHRVRPGLELFGNVMHSQGETDFDSDGQISAHTDFVHSTARIGTNWTITDHWTTEFSASQSHDEGDRYHENEFDSRFDTRRDMADWRNDLTLSDNLDLIIGADWREDHVDSTTDYNEDNRYNLGVYNVLTVHLGRHQLEGSLRQDDNEAYGKNTTEQLAWGWQLDDKTALRASYGTAFRAPTFNQLYWPDDYGNPDLEPEESETRELGLRRSLSRGHVNATYFNTTIDNLISGQPAENQQARMSGLELEGGLQQDDWQVNAALTFLDHEDRDSGNELARRPNESARLDVDRDWGDFSAGVTGIARGRSFDDTANEERLGGYGLLNLRASYAFTPAWTVRAKVDNALDKDYETAAGYNQPGRAFYASIHYQQR